MHARRGLLRLLLCLPLMSGAGMAAEASQNLPPASLPAWVALDHGAAFAAFRRSCQAATVRLAPRFRKEFATLCQAARATSADAAKTFFEANFCVQTGQKGFATGYYEPVIEGRLRPQGPFTAPLRAAPPGLVSLTPGQAKGALSGLTHALKTSGRLRPLPPRAAIEAGALQHLARPLVYVDPVEAFFAQVQGSVAVQLQGGRLLRLGFAGKNGHPYTAIGKVLVSRGAMRLEDVTMESLKSWLRAHPREAGAVMAQNASYIFFAVDEAADPALGPKGALGIPLTPLASAAVDPAHHPLGLPLIVSGGDFARLMIAQDVGSAIRGPGRVDLFLGSGPAAGAQAGGLKRDVAVHQLLPRFMCGGAP